MKPWVSIVIVKYKSEDYLPACLASIGKNSKWEVIIVDNDKKNIGFGAGCNKGARRAKGEFLFFLNPDTVLLPGAIDELVNFLKKEKRAAIVAPLLLDEKGRPYLLQGTRKLTPLTALVVFSFLNKYFPNNPISYRYWLKDWDKVTLHEVDVVPGSAFLIRKNIFEEFGGFDENFFLYFEESDLCKRVREKGWKIFIQPEAEIIHFWGKSTRSSKKISRIFPVSRFYYFNKHYGKFFALIVELFARFNKWHIAFLAVTLLGAFLRFYRLKENLIFHGELGYDYLTIKNFIARGEIPLLGPRTSHEWFAIGPLFYWIFALILPLGNFHPLVGAYFMAIMGVLVIIINFYIIKDLFDKRVALISSFLISISPAWVQLTRDSRFNSLAALLFFPFYYFLVKSLKENGKYLFWAGLFLGLMFSFFPSPVVLLPSALIILYFYRERFEKKYFGVGFLGFLLPNIPFLIYNLLHKFDILIKFSFWIPYRILGFFGLYPKNNATPEVIRANFYSLYNFFQESWVVEKGVFILFLFIAVLLFFLIKTIGGILKHEKEPALTALLVIFIVSYLGLFVHGDPPRHYYLVMFPLPIIFLSLFLDWVFKKKRGFIFVMIILVAASYTNLRYFFSPNWFYLPQDKVEKGQVPIPYKIQEEVATLIIKDANGKKFKLARVGPYDYFEENFAQNYRYLLWRLGNEPVGEAELKYTIYEDTEKLPQIKTDKIFWVSNLAIVKEENELISGHLN